MALGILKKGSKCRWTQKVHVMGYTRCRKSKGWGAKKNCHHVDGHDREVCGAFRKPGRG
ncbi:MAG: hypothetical protein UY96_C0017G0033 [Parcubacteria group bacterium GW2011_GWB1_56_8]|nr:MAG: hypothetical protein UY96_C0017G0033 [Parcubacteria group bacterium GW2011_GWB1_56_8]